MPRESLERAFAVMAAAFHEMASAALPDLQRSPLGRVVAVSSFAAHRFTPDSIYPGSGSAKAALEVLVKCLAIEFGIPVPRPTSLRPALRARMQG